MFPHSFKSETVRVAFGTYISNKLTIIDAPLEKSSLLELGDIFLKICKHGKEYSDEYIKFSEQLLKDIYAKIRKYLFSGVESYNLVNCLSQATVDASNPKGSTTPESTFNESIKDPINRLGVNLSRLFLGENNGIKLIEKKAKEFFSRFFYIPKGDLAVAKVRTLTIRILL